MTLSITGMEASFIAAVKMGFVDAKSNSVPNWTESNIAILAVWHLSAPLPRIYCTSIQAILIVLTNPS